MSRPSHAFGQNRRALADLGGVLLCSAHAARPSRRRRQPTAVTTNKIVPREATVTAEYVAEGRCLQYCRESARESAACWRKQVAVEERGSAARARCCSSSICQPYVVALEQARAAAGAVPNRRSSRPERDLARVQPLSELNAVSQQELDAVSARQQSRRRCG